jgi:peptidyl-prolyl cis-trans isomerase D
MRSAVDSMVNIANELDAELASGATMEEVAELLGLELRRVAAMDAGGKNPEGDVIEGLPPVEEITPAVFQNEPGDDVLLNETRDGNYFVARVDNVTPAAERPLDEVRAPVTELWLSLERDRLALEKAEALAEQARGGETLESLAAAEGLTYGTTDPIARADTGSLDRDLRELGAKLFELADGEITTAGNQGGYLVARLIKIEPVDPSSNPEALEELQEELARSLRSDLLSGFVGSLREDFGVTVNTPVLEAALSAL